MILTDEELLALPEWKDYEIKTLETGETVREPVQPRFVQRAVSDDVFTFTDNTGVWFVDYHLDGGPYKRRAM